MNKSVKQTERPMMTFVQTDREFKLSIQDCGVDIYVSIDAFEIMTMAAAEGEIAFTPERIGSRLADKMEKWVNCPYSRQEIIDFIVAASNEDGPNGESAHAI